VLSDFRSYHLNVLVSPKAVIFDYGNVLSASQPAADVQGMANILGLTVPRFAEIYWQFRLEYDAAVLEPTAYWNTVAQTASRKLTPEQLSALMETDSRSWSHPALATPQWARDFRRAGLRTAILSNMPFPVRDDILQLPWLPEFDARVFSCEAGLCKPSPEIYGDCLRQLGVQPGEVLFLDDREPNIRAAEALGWHAVLFADAAGAAREMAQRFSLPLEYKLG
jgi:putative hydrolase of the HAD superfamily